MECLPQPASFEMTHRQNEYISALLQGMKASGVTSIAPAEMLARQLLAVCDKMCLPGQPWGGMVSG
jgi:hypothetical protein